MQKLGVRNRFVFVGSIEARDDRVRVRMEEERDRTANGLSPVFIVRDENTVWLEKIQVIFRVTF